MGVNDAKEQLEAAKVEVIRLERRVAELEQARSAELAGTGGDFPCCSGGNDRSVISEAQTAGGDSEWVVNVMGPDDVFPATGLLDAIRQAHAINESAVGPGGYYSPEFAPEDREFMTIAWAVPAKLEWLS